MQRIDSFEWMSHINFMFIFYFHSSWVWVFSSFSHSFIWPGFCVKEEQKWWLDFFFLFWKLDAELGLFLLPEGAAAWLHGDSWPCATLQIMLLLISPGFVLAPLLAVSDFMVRRSQRSDKLHDGQSCYWRRKSEMPLPAVSAARTERKIISFIINLTDVSSRVAASAEESRGTAVTQGSSRAQLWGKRFWLCLARYVFFSKNVLSLGASPFARNDSPKLKKMLSLSLTELMSLTDSLISHFSPYLIQHTLHKEITSHKLVKLKFDVFGYGAIFSLPVSDEWLLLWS